MYYRCLDTATPCGQRVVAREEVPDAKPIKVPGGESFDLFVYQDKKTEMWHVVEAYTGLGIARERGPRLVRQEAVQVFKKYTTEEIHEFIHHAPALTVTGLRSAGFADYVSFSAERCPYRLTEQCELRERYNMKMGCPLIDPESGEQ